MAAETRSEETKRTPVPLTSRDRADLALIRNSPAAQRAVGVDATAAQGSEAGLLHELLARVFERAREADEEAAYARYAQWSNSDPEEIAIDRAERARRDRNAARQGKE